jgi:hypothetical protein
MLRFTSTRSSAAPAAAADTVKKAAHPSGQVLHFDQKWHSYKLNGTKKLVSVSSVLNRYFPFDADRVAKLVAERESKTVEQVRAEWERSSVLGRNTHARIEAMILHEPMKQVADLHGDETAFFPVADVAGNSIAASYEVVACEAMLCSPSLRVAGTVDLIGKNRKTGALAILDWKTTAGPLSGFRFSSWDTPASAALAHLQNQKMQRYALQILIYGYIFRQEQYRKVFDKSGVNYDLPIEYGLIQLGRSDDRGVAAEYVRVAPESVLPPDAAGEMSVDSMLLSVLRS